VALFSCGSFLSVMECVKREKGLFITLLYNFGIYFWSAGNGVAGTTGFGGSGQAASRDSNKQKLLGRIDL